jgi:hypothetical protein
MFASEQFPQKSTWRRLASNVAVAGLCLLATTLTGCGPQAQPTLPPPTALSAQPPTATAAPAPVTAAPAKAAVTGQRKAVVLTVLHTNDTSGETDPCG